MNSCLARAPPGLTAVRDRNQEPPPSPEGLRRTAVTPQRPPLNRYSGGFLLATLPLFTFQRTRRVPIRNSECGTRNEGPDRHALEAIRSEFSVPSSALAWWSRWDSNPRPPGCKPGALPTELRPQSIAECGLGIADRQSEIRIPQSGWWAQVDSNHRPRPYQGRALAD